MSSAGREASDGTRQHDHDMEDERTVSTPSIPITKSKTVAQRE